MALTCNIDSRGKRVRLVNGIILLAIAVAIALFWARPYHEPVAWIIAAVCAVLGAFCVFEGWAGWCALRAMGMKTHV